MSNIQKVPKAVVDALENEFGNKEAAAISVKDILGLDAKKRKSLHNALAYTLNKTDAEKAAYTKLKSDEDRAQAMQKFLID